MTRPVSRGIQGRKENRTRPSQGAGSCFSRLGHVSDYLLRHRAYGAAFNVNQESDRSLWSMRSISLAVPRTMGPEK